MMWHKLTYGHSPVMRVPGPVPDTAVVASCYTTPWRQHSASPWCCGGGSQLSFPIYNEGGSAARQLSRIPRTVRGLSGWCVTSAPRLTYTLSTLSPPSWITPALNISRKYIQHLFWNVSNFRFSAKTGLAFFRCRNVKI